MRGENIWIEKRKVENGSKTDPANLRVVRLNESTTKHKHIDIRDGC